MSDEAEPETRAKLPDHRGLATLGDRRVPLEDFASAVGRHGRRLGRAERERAAAALLAPRAARETPEGPFARIVVFGGVYSNRFALAALLEESVRLGAEALYCLGDLGGFGPEPDAIRGLLDQGEVRCIAGNYELALAAGLDDCRCGYTDPRDKRYAALSYDYTAARTSQAFKDWMGTLPPRRRVLVGSRELLLVHGSPRRVNEFLFRSTTPVAFLERLLEQWQADGMLCTHTGLHWHRRLPSGGDAVNVGVIGRPANDGRTEVWYALLDARGGELGVELRPLRYDHAALAAAMRAEALPEPFVETVLSGWWTTCLEILPARERAASRF